VFHRLHDRVVCSIISNGFLRTGDLPEDVPVRPGISLRVPEQEKGGVA